MSGANKLRVRIGERVRVVSIEKKGGSVTARVDDKEYRLGILVPHQGVYSFIQDEAGGVCVEAIVTPGKDGAGCFLVRTRDRSFEARVERPGSTARPAREQGTTGRQVLKAVMPGRIVRVLLEPGAPVKRGQGLVVVEAMKMENEIVSPKEGTVKEILVAPGDRVEAGAALAVVE